MFRRVSLLLAIACASLTTPQAAGQSSLYIELYLGGDTYNDLDSHGTMWLEANGTTWRSTFDFRHWIHLSSNELYVVEDSGRQHRWLELTVDDRHVGTGLTPNCYRSRITCTAKGNGLSQVMDQARGSSIRCIAPPPSEPNCKEPLADGSCPPTGSECQPEDEFCNLSPVVIDMEGRGYQLTGVENPIQFDLDADGDLETTGWTRGIGLAFLAIDRNGNGSIDNGSELFGDATPSTHGTAAHGFEAMAQYDSNGDELLDPRDAIWQSLVLWEDANHNGFSESHELRPVTRSAITALDLRYQWTRRQDESGNIFRYKAQMEIDRRTRTYYDIFFRVQN